MPEIGEIKKGCQLGRKDDHHKYIWTECEGCNNRRWVMMSRGEPRSRLCHACNIKSDNHPNWKGGRRYQRGYIMLKLEPHDFFFPMATGTGLVFEHRLVVAKRLGRCLHSWEMVHHRDGIRAHNNDNNLQLVQEMQHKQLTRLEKKIEELQQRVILLEFENAILRVR